MTRTTEVFDRLDPLASARAFDGFFLCFPGPGMISCLSIAVEISVRIHIAVLMMVVMGEGSGDGTKRRAFW